MNRPAHHLNNTKNSFQNPWGADDNTWNAWSRSLSSITRLPFSLEWDTQDKNSTLPEPIKVVKPDFTPYRNAAADLEQRIYATWMGHAAFLARMPGGVNILFDPIFSNRASPSAWIGPARRLASPCTIADLPRIDFVVISHDHYDHCDVASISMLHQKQVQLAQPIEYLVPLGLKSLLTLNKIPRESIHELDWWETANFRVPHSESTAHTFTCLPAQHNSGRSVHDHGSTLWAGWSVQETQDSESGFILASLYFAGDTGFLSPASASGGSLIPCPAFVEIGERLGPFDVAIIPIWRGASLSFLSRWGLRLSDVAIGNESGVTMQENRQHDFLRYHHATPEDALSLSVAVRARHSLASHFATFAGSEGEALEPIVRLKNERKGNWNEEGGFGWLDVGGTAVIDCAMREANESLIKDT